MAADQRLDLSSSRHPRWSDDENTTLRSSPEQNP
jgi:hypothetical protein